VRERRFSLLALSLVFSIGGMALTGGLALLISFGSIASLSSGLVSSVYDRILEGAAKSFIASVGINYGDLRLVGGHLEGDGGTLIAKSSQAADALSRQATVDAAIFRRAEGFYIVEQTSLRLRDGARAVGLSLQAGSPAVAALDSGEDFKGRVVLDGEPYMAYLSPLQDATGASIGALFVGQSLAEVDGLISQGYKAIALRTILSVAAAVALIALAAGIGLRASLVPLRRTVSALARISAEGGDLTQRIEAARRDETGELALAFNGFLERLRGEFSRMKAVAADLGRGAVELESSSASAASSSLRISGELEALRGGIALQRSHVAESTSAIEQISKSLEALDRRVIEGLSGIEDSSAAITQIARGIESESSRITGLVGRVTDLKKAAGKGSEALEAASAEILQVARLSERILELNELMASLSSRTDLLAMNAAIEAAHAGDAGKGFAVVADEIRNLAEESGERAKETAEELAAIKAGIDRIVASSRGVETVFAKIDDSIARTDLDLAAIARDVAESEASARGIASGLGLSSAATRAIRAGSSEMAAGGRLALGEMRSLLELATAIEDNASRIAQEAGGISAQAAALASGATENAAGAAALDAELSAYRTA
jgi:methyl-accepting chemotaxis protein